MCAGKGPLPALQTAPSFTLDVSGQKYIGPVQKQRSKEQAAEKEEKEKIKDVSQAFLPLCMLSLPLSGVLALFSLCGSFLTCALAVSLCR